MRAWIDALSRTVQALEERLRDLEQRLNQNSRNSSQPPALDRKANRPKPARAPTWHTADGPRSVARLWATAGSAGRLPATAAAPQFRAQQPDAGRRVWAGALSEGGQASRLERAGAAAQPVAETIRVQIQQSAVVGCDETRARLDGQLWWQWVFVGSDAIYHIIVRRRSASLIASVRGEAQVEVWGSDGWKPQFQAPAQHFQLCLAQQLRNLQGLSDRCPRLRWARTMQPLFRTAMQLAKHRQLTERGFARPVQRLEKRLEELLRKELRRQLARALFRRCVTHRAKRLLCLHDPRVPFHNTACQRALRPAVIHRKVSGGFRSEGGAQASAALASVIDTAQFRGQPIFQMLVNLMGTPIRHYFTA